MATAAAPTSNDILAITDSWSQEDPFSTHGSVWKMTCVRELWIEKFNKLTNAENYNVSWGGKMANVQAKHPENLQLASLITQDKLCISTIVPYKF